MEKKLIPIGLSIFRRLRLNVIVCVASLVGVPPFFLFLIWLPYFQICCYSEINIFSAGIEAYPVVTVGFRFS